MCDNNEEICNDNYIAYVGYQEISPCIQELFSIQSVNRLSKKITQLLMGVDPQNRPIIVPNDTICSVMSDVYRAYRAPTGDIYTRYIVPPSETDDYVQSIINQTIEVIVADVKNNIGMDLCNSKLTKWTTVYGDFNPHGLRQHSQIKIRNKRPNPMQFFENY